MGRLRVLAAAALAGTLMLTAGCGGDKDKKPEPAAAKKTAGAATRITVVAAPTADVQVTQRTVGELESPSAPVVAAEVEGRVVEVAADVGEKVSAGQLLLRLDDTDYQIARRAANAEVGRLDALVGNQQRTAARYQRLVKNKSISPDKLDEANANLAALRQQLKGAKARLDRADRDLARCRITAPIDGRIDARMVTAGDYAKIGAPLFRLTAIRHLRARLPLPETLADRLHTGLEVRLTSPTAPDKVVNGRISEIRPMVGTSNRAVEVIAELDNPGGWQPGASVTGEVILAERPQAVVVPETAVVLRPAGDVVYVIKDGVAHQRPVTVGERFDGRIEIRQGLKAGETVAVNGAGFLTDGARVAVEGKK